MSIEKLSPHYAMQNIPTVYDEEALTALEMCGRMGAKLNEVISAVNGWNVPNIIHVSPTGDKSGELDRAVIQGKLDQGYAVQLEPGEYYLSGPLLFQPGYMLQGESQLKTVINCKYGFIDHADSVSVDHVEVRDVRVKGPGFGVGIDISRKVSGIETGGRYAHFMNVYISGYDTAVLMGGCWCTNFTHCRIEASAICVEQRGGCNHIKYDHCMFLGPVDQKTTTGIKITAEGGAENYGISVDHCDFERHKYAIHAYYCVALNVTAMYVEGTDTVFQLDSCPRFLCSGGYISYPRIVLQGGRTNELPLYAKSGSALRDLFVKVNSAEKWPLMSTPDPYTVATENITVVNDGAGVCYANAQHYTSIYNGVILSHKCKLTKLFTNINNQLLLPIEYVPGGKQLKFISANIEATGEFTQSNTPGKITIKDATGAAKLEITIPTGTHPAGTRFQSHAAPDIGTNYENLICDTAFVNFWPENIANDGALFNIFIEIAIDNFIL